MFNGLFDNVSSCGAVVFWSDLTRNEREEYNNIMFSMFIVVLMTYMGVIVSSQMKRKKFDIFL